MKKQVTKKKFKYVNLLIIIVSFFAVSLISIGYSALNVNLTISGEVAVTPASSVYISNIELLSITDSTELYSSSFTDTTATIGLSVPSATSSFEYQVTIKNDTVSTYHLREIIENDTVNQEIEYLVDLYIYTEFEPNSETTFKIFFNANSVPTNEELKLTLEFVFGFGEIYHDDNLDGSDPEIIDGLIPIVYNDTIDKWEKADVLNAAWFNYDEQQWANAASVTAATRTFYVEADPGTPVEMDDITSMMVWIPRFSYTIRDELGYHGFGASPLTRATPGAVDIRFVDIETLDTGSAEYTGLFAENYYTPSAFCWGNTCDDPATRNDPGNVEIPGFWVAKFEASKIGSLLASKPSVTPLNYQTISQSFYEVQSLMNGTAGYENYGYVGFVDAHLMKNTEWGAIAYLSQSKYGKYGNTAYSGVNKEIYPNNCLNYITGIGGDAPSVTGSTTTCVDNTYDTYEGMGASTTGNIYGIYDTVGGAFDRVMGAILNSSGNFETESSGFTTLPEGRYVNVYPFANYGLATTLTIKGDALTDTLGFYDDRGVTTSFLNYNWFYRGGSLYGNVTTINGIFSYTAYNGQADINHASRYTVTIY